MNKQTELEINKLITYKLTKKVLLGFTADDFIGDFSFKNIDYPAQFKPKKIIKKVI